MAIVGLTASAASHTAIFNLTPGSAAELRLMNYTTGTDYVVQELKAGSNQVTLNDDRYYLHPAEGRTLEYVKDSSGATLPVQKSGAVIITFTEGMSPYFNVSTTPEPVMFSSTVFVNNGSSAVIKKFNTVTEKFETAVSLLQGDNEVKFVDGGHYYIAPGPDHTLVSVVDNKGTTLPLVDSEFGLVYELTATEATVARVYSVTTDGPPPVDPWMKPFTMDIDDADAITVSLSPSYTRLDIESGLHNYYFNTQRGDMGVWIVTKNQRDLYSVKLNGVKQDAGYTALAYISEGDHVEIRYNYPDDLYYTYTLQYVDEGNFWTRITVDGVDYTPVNNKITAKAGAKIELWNDNATEWNITSISLPSGRIIRGNYGYSYEMDPSKPIEFFATYSEKFITVDAHRYGEATVQFNIVGQQYVKVTTGIGNSVEEITGLKEGENKITDQEGRFQTVTITPKSDDTGYISSVVYRTSTYGARQAAAYDYKIKGYVLHRLSDGALVEINAVDKASTFNITVNVNSPRDVELYSDASLSQASRITTYLSEGNNTVPFPADKPDIYVKPAADNSFIKSVTWLENANASTVQATELPSGAWYIANVRAGGTLTIVSGHNDTFENQCMVYVDRATGVTLMSPDDRVIALKDGHNLVDFNESENNANGRTGFVISVPEGSDFTAYKNGRAISKSANSNSAAEVMLRQADVIKIYTLTLAPSMVKVTFTGDENSDFRELIMDDFTPVESWTKSMSVLPGTRFSFLPPAIEGQVYVKINNVSWRADSDGYYRFNALDDTNVEMIVKPKGDSIDTISIESIDEASAVFDLTGRRVDASRLQPGIYIVVKDGKAVKVALK